MPGEPDPEYVAARRVQPDLAAALSATVAGKRLLPTPLTGARASAGAPLDARWQVLVNDDVEPDL